GFVPLELDEALTSALKAFGLRHGATAFMTVLAGWALVLSKLSGQKDVVIGTPTANRTRSEVEGLIGFFVNTLALRLDLSGSPTVEELLGRVRAAALGAQEHQDLPFEQVVEQINPVRSLAHAPLFQVMLAWEKDEDGAFELPGLSVGRVKAPHVASKFDLALMLVERGGRIVGGIEYASALFDAATVRRFARHLRRVLAGLIADPRRPVGEIDLLGEAERRQLLHGWNATRREPPPASGFLRRFEAQAARGAQETALVFMGEGWTYGELNRAANQLAHFLIGRGVGPDDRVGLCMERSPEMVVGLLAILKAGAAYVPLDPAYPAERLAFMLSDAAPKLLLTQQRLRGILPQEGEIVPAWSLDEDRGAWAGEPDGDPEVAVDADNLAYVIYTSGSTGRPKGVAQTRRALDNLIGWQVDHAAADSPVPARVLQFASLNFDVSFQEILSTLCLGRTLVLMDEASRKDLGQLRRFIAEHGVQRAFLPYAVVQQMANLSSPGDPVPEGGCEIVTAGEALQVNDDLRACMRALGGRYLYNQYGPTETHAASQYPLSCAAMGGWPDAPPIGRPIDNIRLYVLDEGLNAVPVGVAGELYIAGVGLARGYLNRPGLTAERFLPDPHADAPGARMYRSGDLARFLPDGNIEYLGRIDQQVKLRGFRIELGEVESVLQRQPGVREAVVLLREDDPGDKRLVAYVVGTAGADLLRDRLLRLLPDYMVPTRWMMLDRLPLTANGKLDRRALPAPGQERSGADYVAPRSAAQALMAEIWAEILKRDRVGIHDNFFDLGGHSLLATRLIHAINQRMSARLSLSSLFRHPVLADLAAELERGKREAGAQEGAQDGAIEAIRPDWDARHQPFPLTDIQQAYWFGREATVGLGGVAAHGYEETRVRGLDVDRFERALNRVIRRHDMLRALFLGDGTQRVLEEVPYYRLSRDDLRGLDRDAVAAGLARTRERMSHQVLDASRWPLFEFRLTELDDGVAHLHISMDGLIVDAASSQILARELMAFYADPEADLPPLELTFRDYVLAERAQRATPRYERALRYWRDRVADLAPAPSLPLVRPPESIAAAHFTRRDLDMPADRWSRLKEVGRQFSVTPSVLLLTAFSEVLALWSRHPRFTLSLPLFNRQPLHPGVNAIIGDFTSLVLLEVEVDGKATFAQKARAIQERLWRDMDHAAVSGVRVLRELSQARGAQQTAMPIVFNSTLSEAAPEQAEYSLSEALGAQNVHSITQTPQVWIDHTLLEYEGRLIFNWDSIDELFPEGMVADMFAAYCGLLDRLAEPAAWQSTTPASLPFTRLLPPADAAPASAPLMHELFDRQALATPAAPAVLGGSRSFDYGELRRCARRLGGRLQARGVRPNRLVAVMMERGWEQVLGTLAVLYAGGAYLPIDPALPVERVHYILERAEVELVLTQSALRRRSELPEGVEAIAVDDLADDLADDGDGPELRPVALDGTDLAYVIYTSGSTGTPKGVVIDHRGAVNTLLDINERFAVGPSDRVLAISSLSFDLSVYDFFGTL
ncbi:non-ribosomal peptide synthetase, partial [Arenibaculum sp.]|uniref:non-ribosomal peptide synthetase n=1 Tax=Arenibaculum sp. TaxID=2865862 RepID=UPI002E1068F6